VPSTSCAHGNNDVHESHGFIGVVGKHGIVPGVHKPGAIGSIQSLLNKHLSHDPHPAGTFGSSAGGWVGIFEHLVLPG